MNRNQKENLEKLQSRILESYDFHIPTTELIRDAINHFLIEMDKDIGEYIYEKRLFKGEF